MKAFLKSITTNELIRKPVHTFWQAFLATLLVTSPSIHDLHSAQSVGVAAVAAGLSALKSVYITRQ